MKASRFRRIRIKRLDLTRRELAQALRVTVQAVQNWDAGRQRPPGPVAALMECAESNVQLCFQLRALAGKSDFLPTSATLPTSDFVPRLAEALGVSEGWLLGNEP
jgi:DNA-binding XRE family transcriptional regulator